MQKEIIHFAHANGFPARTYNKLFSFLEDDFEIGFIERHGHDPKFPVRNEWRELREELKLEIENRYDKPVIGIGHSLGGILHLLNASENPELYKAVVLLDAMIISPLSSLFIKISRNTSIFEKKSPTRTALSRRNFFKSKDEAFRHYSKKFKNFDKEVLRDYVEHGLIENGDGFELFIKPSIEAEIYRTLPSNLYKLKGKLKTPVIYIGGKNSREAKLARVKYMFKKFPFDTEMVEGTHLFPFENPQKTAKIIRKKLAGLDIQ